MVLKLVDSFFFFLIFRSVQSLSRVWLFVTPWIAARQASLSITNSQSVHSDSCPSSRWRHPAISSSVIPFSPCPQSLPASESFPVSQLFARGGQSLLEYNWFTMLCLISAVQQSDPAMHICILFHISSLWPSQDSEYSS